MATAVGVVVVAAVVVPVTAVVARVLAEPEGVEAAPQALSKGMTVNTATANTAHRHRQALLLPPSSTLAAGDNGPRR